MNIIKRILLLLLFIFLAIQFIRPRKNVSVNAAQHIRQTIHVPANVEVILKKACYDCHSDNTRYPWYAAIQPFAWFLADHVKDGKRHLNFNTLSSLENKKQRNKYREIEEVMEDGTMPLSSYTLIHRDAVLTPEEKQTIIAWAGVMEGRVD